MSLTKVSYSMINGAYVNVLDFGADPTGSTDSTSAIQTAIESINAGVVFFPLGTYKTTAKIYTSYGKNIKLQGSTIYGGVTVKAYHADHVFEYKFTVHIDGITFTRDAAYVATAKTNQKNAIHSDNTAGAIDGAAYTRIENCAVSNSYAGLRAHGTFQFVENCTANDNQRGMWVIGAEHTLMQNAQEGNTESGLIIEGNGIKVYSNYADDNCSISTALRGAVTFVGDQNVFIGGHFNDNNAAPLIYFDKSRRNYVGNCEFYALSTNPRISVYSTGGNDSFSNVVEMTTPPLVSSYGNSYNNTFPEGTTYAVTDGAFDNLNPVIPVYAITFAFGAADIGAGATRLLNGTSAATHALSLNRYFGEATFINNVELDVIGGQLYLAGDGTPQTLDVKVQCVVTTSGGGTTPTNLITYAGTNSFGAEANSTATREAPITCGQPGTQLFSFSIKNDSAIALKGGSVCIYYRIKSNGVNA